MKLGDGLGAEVVEQPADDLLLLGVDEVEVGELFDVSDVDEECLRIDHIVVDVLEVVEQNLSP